MKLTAVIGRYIAKEILTQFATTFVVINTVVFISQLLRLAEMLFQLGISIENILLPVLFEVVSTAAVTIPTALLFATMLAIGRLNRSGELAALLAAGYSLFGVLRSVLLIATPFYVLTLIAALYLDPWGRQELLTFSQHKAYEKVANIRHQLRAGVFSHTIPGYILHVQRVSNDGKQYTAVLLAPHTEPQTDFVMTARTAKLAGTVATGDLHLVFTDGIIHTTNTVLQFQRGQLDLVSIVQQHLLGRKHGFDARRLYPYALWQHQRDTASVANQPSLSAQLLFHRRLGRPLLTLVFALFGMLLGMHRPRRKRNLAPIFALLTVITCFSLGSACEFIAGHQLSSPALAIWLPHLLLGSGALLLAIRKSRRPLGEPLLRWR